MTEPETIVQFTEEMKGFLSPGERPFEDGYQEGRKQGHDFMFHSTMTIRNIEAFVQDPSTPSEMHGWIRSSIFGGQSEFYRASFRLYVDQETPLHKRMCYRIVFRHPQSQELFTAVGFKDVKQRSLFVLWRDTTTLFTHVYSGEIEEGREDGNRPLYTGIIRILPLDFLKQLTTFRAPGSAPLLKRIGALLSFNTMFAGTLIRIYVFGRWSRV